MTWPIAVVIIAGIIVLGVLLYQHREIVEERGRWWRGKVEKK
jgi:hypothetical protein